MSLIYKYNPLEYKILIKLQVFLSFLFSGSAISLALDDAIELAVLMFLIALAITTLFLKYRGRSRVRNKTPFLLVLSVLVVAVISAIIHYSTFSITVDGRNILVITQAFLLICCFDSCTDAAEMFVSVMNFFAIIAIVFWFIFVAIGVTSSWMPQIVSITNSEVRYNTIGIFNIMIGLTRNCGPFWEPSIFASFLMAALVLSRFCFSKGLKDNIVLIIAILVSQSSGGIVMLAIFLVLSAWDNKGKEAKSIILKIVLIALMIGAFLSRDIIQEYLMSIDYNMFDKIFNFPDNASSNTRLVSMAIDIRIWQQSPLFGVGVTEMENTFVTLRTFMSQITGLAHTSTSTEYMAAYGIGGIWINILWIKGIISKKRSLVTNIGLILIFYILLNGTPQISFVYTYFILFILTGMKYENIAGDKNISSNNM